jgi:hypothetical protein
MRVTYLLRSRYRDWNGGKRLMRLALAEFLRRFFLHALPRAFVRIRHFGFLAQQRRAKLLPLCFARLAATSRYSLPCWG